MEQPNYQQQQATNENAFREVARTVRPDVYSIMDRLDTYGVNYVVLLKVIEHLNRVATGTKFGTVSVDIQDNVVTFIRSLENSRVNENILRQ